MVWLRKPQFLVRAEQEEVLLHKELLAAVARVEPMEDPLAFQGVSMRNMESAEAVFSRWNGRALEVVLDFGRYCVGQVTIGWSFDRRVDSPLRTHVRFGETPAEIAAGIDDYNGHLGRGWLQEELVVLDCPGAQFTLPRRYAFRYLAIRIDGGPNYRFRLDSLEVENVSCVNRSAVSAVNEIDRISLNTLAACMQEVFEDGPKRDRRLWLGDLRLQALVNYVTYQNHSLVKRCLYLFAAFARPNGAVPADLYSDGAGENLIFDYLGMFPVALWEYWVATGDRETLRELWPVAARQLDIMLAEFDESGNFHNHSDYWLFIDWSDSLDRNCAEYGVMLFALKAGVSLAELNHAAPLARKFDLWIARLTLRSQELFYHQGAGVFLSNGQFSWASQVWMALGGVPGGGAALLRALKDPTARKPGGPYLYSYTVEALLQCGFQREADALLEEYWGKMAHFQFDTFPEVFVPEEPFRSPYGDWRINSACHAWSCTPAFFLRRECEWMKLVKLVKSVELLHCDS